MKNKKLFIIAAVVVLVVVAAAAIIIIGKNSSDNKDDDRVYVNLVDKYATEGIRSHIVIPERASGEGESYVKEEAPIKVYEKFTLTEDEVAKMKELVAQGDWHLMAAAKFSDSAAKAHFKNIFAYSGLDLSYNAKTTYYIIRTSEGGFISASKFMPASSCEIAVFDVEDYSYYYIRFDN